MPISRLLEISHILHLPFIPEEPAIFDGPIASPFVSLPCFGCTMSE